MTRKEEKRMLSEKARAFFKGELESKKYTKEELEEKRKYYERQNPPSKYKIPRRRWLYEIKRIFELCEEFEDCPDGGFARLDFVLKFGL